MATITKQKPDRYRIGSSYSDALEGTYFNYSAGDSLSLPSVGNRTLMFEYQLATTAISSMSFTFYLASRKNAGDDPAVFVISLHRKDTGSTLASKNIDLTELNNGKAGGKYVGDVTASFSVSVTDVSTLYVRVFIADTGNNFNIVGKSATVYGTQATLSVSFAKTTVDVRDMTTVTFTNRVGATLRAVVYLQNSYSQWVSVASYVYNDDSVSLTFLEEWFTKANYTWHSAAVKMVVSDDAGRTADNASQYVRMYREPITISLGYDVLDCNSTQSVSITDPYNRNSYDVEIHSTNGYYVLLHSEQGISGGTYSFTLDENAFVSASKKGQELWINVKVTDASSGPYNRSIEKNYKMTRQGIGVFVIAYVDTSTDPITDYAVTGEMFRLQFFYRWNRELTLQFKCGNKTLKNSAGGTGYLARDDITPIDCLKRWFDDAAVTTADKMQVSVTVSDEMLRETTVSFEVRAGSDMYPIVSVSTTPIQQASWPSELDPYYVQGYTRIKFEAMVAAQTNAPIMAVSLSSNQIGSFQLLYNNVTGKYEAESQAPLIADTDYVITATDKRGLSSVTQSSTVPILLYTFPNITVDSYHRCQPDKTPDDSGAYCHLIVTYVFSALNNLNRKDTSVSTTDYTDERTLSSYISQEEYLFPANIERSYQIVLAAEDLLNSTSKTIALSTAGVIMDFLSGGKGIGLGKVAELQNCVEVNPEWRFKAATIELNGTDLGTLLAQIQQRLTNGGL